MKATVWVSFVVLQPLIYWLVTASVGLTIWFIFLGGGGVVCHHRHHAPCSMAT